MNKPQLQVLADDLNNFVNSAFSHIPIKMSTEVQDGLGVTFCVAAAYFSYKQSPRTYLLGAGLGFILSMQHTPDHPFSRGLKNKTILSIWAKDGMTYQKALPILWLLGWNWSLATGFIAGHTAYHLGKPQIDATIKWGKDQIS
ncbi:hypothetical protein [Candidatus Neptunichlamydia sp. REUL1]|uniref:hypothetical protein n=1 Tax=Candidatus Neptunichlamydia sp. REUL1 TaxID=3064277 RepID=UPI002930C8CF|nr:hypothetical protein [Candidatus Neptunochlamydia sp. REUL1]